MGREVFLRRSGEEGREGGSTGRKTNWNGLKLRTHVGGVADAEGTYGGGGRQGRPGRGCDGEGNDGG